MGHLQKLVSKNYILRRRCILLRRSYLYERPCKRAEGPRSLVMRTYSKSASKRNFKHQLRYVSLYSFHSNPECSIISLYSSSKVLSR